MKTVLRSFTALTDTSVANQTCENKMIFQSADDFVPVTLRTVQGGFLGFSVNSSKKKGN